MDSLDRHYPLIGKVVVEFQGIDLTLNIILGSLLIKEDINIIQAFAVSLSFSKKMDVLKSIAPFKIQEPDLLKILDKVLKELSQAESERNRIVHAHWMAASDGSKVALLKPSTSRRHGLRGGISWVSPDEIEKVITYIQKAKSSLWMFGAELEKRGVIRLKMFSMPLRESEKS